MLVSLFESINDAKHPHFKQTMNHISVFRSKLAEMEHVLQNTIYKLDLMSDGLGVALYELEQSLRISEQLSDEVHRKYYAKMDDEERKDYRRYVYFYKNALIRIFSTLDKTGHFMNAFYTLETEKVKSGFSFFTVLRHMYHVGKHPDSQRKLYEIKRRFETPMQQLRKQRNSEIHVLNIDLLDDMAYLEHTLPSRIRIEDIDAHMALLQQGFEMVCSTLETLFAEAVKTIEETGRLP